MSYKLNTNVTNTVLIIIDKKEKKHIFKLFLEIKFRVRYII